MRYFFDFERLCHGCELRGTEQLGSQRPARAGQRVDHARGANGSTPPSGAGSLANHGIPSPWGTPPAGPLRHLRKQAGRGKNCPACPFGCRPSPAEEPRDVLPLGLCAQTCPRTTAKLQKAVARLVTHDRDKPFGCASQSAPRPLHPGFPL